MANGKTHRRIGKASGALAAIARTQIGLLVEARAAQQPAVRWWDSPDNNLIRDATE